MQRLRRHLDFSTGDLAQMLTRPFDVATANELYKKLLGPFEKELAGVKHLIVVPDGPLQSLPLDVLVTEMPAVPVASIGDHANVAWLAKQFAITTLPAVGSLRALRAFAKAAPAPDAFGAFGDPLLDGGKSDGHAKVAALFSRGAVADVSEVRKLARLPETADELRAIASALKWSRDTLHLGSAATETQVKKLDLARFRTVAFATHGLISGDFKGLAEPALVLTPPAQRQRALAAQAQRRLGHTLGVQHCGGRRHARYGRLLGAYQSVLLRGGALIAGVALGGGNRRHGCVNDAHVRGNCEGRAKSRGAAPFDARDDAGQEPSAVCPSCVLGAVRGGRGGQRWMSG